MYPEGLLERRIVWGEGPWRETNMLRAWEVVLEGKAYAKRPKCGNCTDCKGHPVPISKVVNGIGSISSPVLSVMLGLVGLSQTPTSTTINGFHDRAGHLQDEIGPTGQRRTQG
jgi:hypothetical protein